MLLPTTCPVCGRPGRAPCDGCLVELRRAPPAPAPHGLVACHALLRYEGAGRELVARLKYRNARAGVAWLAGAMAELVGAELVGAEPPAVVTWTPTSAARRRERGFDQSRLLALAVARRLGRPVRPLLRRRPGPAQTGRSRADRRRGPPLAPDRRLVRAPPATVLLVDDVVTTGASLTAAARVLRAAGVGQVTGLVAARTP